MRESALKAKSMNNLRQINTALHNYTTANRGELPTIIDPMRPTGLGKPPLDAIAPYLDGQYKLYISPADPSINYSNHEKSWMCNGKDDQCSSYAYNAVVFADHKVLPGCISDGTSSTIAFTEHYSRCSREN